MKFRHGPVAMAVYSLCAVAASVQTAHAQSASYPDPPTQLMVETMSKADALRRDLYTIDSRISLGVGYVSDDNRRFGMYRSLTEAGVYGLLDLDLIRRDEATGTWFKLWARAHDKDSLGDRELRVVAERQGQWGLSLWGQQMARREPLLVNTGLQGIGTGTQVISGTAPKRDVQLQVDHDIFSIGGRRMLADGLELVVQFRQDDAVGSRMYGRGQTNMMEFLTEPIDRTTKQWGATLSYATRKFQLYGGYNGSSYDNNIPVLKVSGGNTAFGTWNMAMPPSNSAHQWHLSGGYNFSAATRSAFKFSQTVALQNETFSSDFVRLAGAPESLNGRLVTTLGHIDLTMRPSTVFDLSAIVRFEDRDDETPIARYLAEQLPTVGGNYATAGVTGLNKPKSLRMIKSTGEAGYRFADGYRFVAAVEHESMHRKAPEKYRRVSFRERTDELTGRLELKKTMSDTLNGSLAIVQSERTGSDYMPDTYDPNALTNQVRTLLWADRSRQKVKLSLDWTPAEDWSVQASSDVSQDDYSGRPLGPKRGISRLSMGEVGYRINEKWSASAWVSHEMLSSQQETRSDRVGAATLGYDTRWAADLRYNTEAAGLHLKGQLSPKLQVGADLSASREVAQSWMGQTGGSGTATLSPLPDYFYKQKSLRLFADYAKDAFSGYRFNIRREQRSTNDWTWVNWTYNGSAAIAAAARVSDGTTVKNPIKEDVDYVMISYYMRFR